MKEAWRKPWKIPKHRSRRDRKVRITSLQLLFLRVLFTAIQIHSMSPHDTVLEHAFT